MTSTKAPRPFRRCMRPVASMARYGRWMLASINLSRYGSGDWVRPTLLAQFETRDWRRLAAKASNAAKSRCLVRLVHFTPPGGSNGGPVNHQRSFNWAPPVFHFVCSSVLALACSGDVETAEEPVAVTPPTPPRPSCDDNPLLAGCMGPPSSSVRPDSGMTDPDQGTQLPSELDLARAAAENILRVNCGACHGPALSPAAALAGMNYIDDMDELVAQDKVIPLDAASSLVVRRMRDGSMPPLNSPGPRPSPQDIDTVADFIDNPVFWPDREPVRCDAPLMTFDDVFRVVQRDLRNQEAEDRQFVRYLTLSNRYNAGACATQLDVDRHAVKKVVNMLSTRARITQPFAVDREQIIYRLDMRDYDWNRPIEVDGEIFADAWEAIIARSAYAVPFVGDSADDIREDAQTDVAVLYADAMLDVATLGNLYYALIGVDLARSIDDFVAQDLGIDVVENLEEGDAVRAGTTRSQISRQDRVVERHGIQVRRGAYWQSFDFAPDQSNESIFINPFVLNQGGTEAIFTLPNGMLGFIIADANGSIVEESEILLDTFQDDFVARTAVSCSGCHAQGFNMVEDEIRPFADRNPLRFNRDETEILREVYLRPLQFAEVIQQDSRDYQDALSRAGLPTLGRDPISAIYIAFNADLQLSRAAADLAVSADLLRRELNLLDPALRVLKQHRIDRDDFTAFYTQSLCILHNASDNQPDPERCEQAFRE